MRSVSRANLNKQSQNYIPDSECLATMNCMVSEPGADRTSRIFITAGLGRVFMQAIDPSKRTLLLVASASQLRGDKL